MNKEINEGLDSPIVGDMNKKIKEDTSSKEIKEDTSSKDIKSEESIYKEVHLYLSQHCYPPDTTKQDKCIIRKRENSHNNIE